jgi:hypothetical protein
MKRFLVAFLVGGLAVLGGCHSDGEPAKTEDLSAMLPAMSPLVEGELTLHSWDHVQSNRLDPKITPVVLHEGNLLTTIDVTEKTSGDVFIANMEGQLVKMLHRGIIRQGVQQFTFSHDPLPLGEYMFYLCFPMQEDTVVTAHFSKH